MSSSRPDEEFPYTLGEVTFDLLEGRPGQEGDIFSVSLREFLKAWAVRVTLRGHTDAISSDLQKYFGIIEMEVHA